MEIVVEPLKVAVKSKAICTKNFIHLPLSTYRAIIAHKTAVVFNLSSFDYFGCFLGKHSVNNLVTVITDETRLHNWFAVARVAIAGDYFHVSYFIFIQVMKNFSKD